VDFYNVKTRQKVNVSESQIRKRRTSRQLSGGRTQERYAAVAKVDVEGKPINLYKFLSRADFEALQVPEES
jgi:ABC-type thiamine transport system ATPase subunit